MPRRRYPQPRKKRYANSLPSSRLLSRCCEELVKCPHTPVSNKFAKELFTKGVRCKKKQPQWFVKLAKAVRDGKISVGQAKKPLSAMEGGGFITTLAAAVLPGLISYGVKKINNRIAANKRKKKAPRGGVR